MEKNITVLEDSFQQKGSLTYVFKRKYKLPNLKKLFHCSLHDSLNISCTELSINIFLFLFLGIFLKTKATKTYKLKVFTLDIRSLPMHTSTCLTHAPAIISQIYKFRACLISV